MSQCAKIQYHTHTCVTQFVNTVGFPVPILNPTSNFKLDHFQLPTHFHCHFHFHTSPSPITHLFWPTHPFSHMASFNYLPILTTTCICTALYPWLRTPNSHPKPYLPNSDVFLIATSDYTPALTTTSIFTHDQFTLPTYRSHHFQFPTWPLSISQPIWPLLWITSRISILPEHIQRWVSVLLLWIFQNLVLTHLPPGTTPYISGW